MLTNEDNTELWQVKTQVLIVKVNIGALSYEAMTFQWCWSVIQIKSSDL